MGFLSSCTLCPDFRFSLNSGIGAQSEPESKAKGLDLRWGFMTNPGPGCTVAFTGAPSHKLATCMSQTKEIDTYHDPTTIGSGQSSLVVVLVQ